MLKNMIDKAANGERLMCDALFVIARVYILHGEPMPESLGRWTADVLADLVEPGRRSRPRPKGRRGPEP